MKATLAAVTLLLVVAVAALVPLQPYQDFQVLFHADMGLLNGIPLYDRAGQVGMIAQFANVPPAQVYVLPFPYPPWYALATVWLARFPVATAARFWFALNLLMLLASIGLLTRGQPLPRRVLTFVGALFWLPALGSLLVGQYGFPVLLGAALMVYALEQQRPVLVALAAALLTFKPHLGLAIIALVAAWLLIGRGKFRRDASIALLAAAAALFGLGFLASPRWPQAYAASLLGFRTVHGVLECTQCVSLPVALARFVGGTLATAAWISLALAIVVCIWLVWRWRRVATTAAAMVSIGALIPLLVSPYVLKYDYLLLLAPIVLLARVPHRSGEWLFLALAYSLPWVALAFWSEAVNLALIVSTCVVLVLTLRHLKLSGSRLAEAAT